MKIHTLLEAGTPTLTKHSIDDGTPIQTIISRIRDLGAGQALDHMIKFPDSRLFRGMRGGEHAPIVVQDTWSSVRRSQNTTNYVTWLTEVLPSWKAAGLPARSKTVSAHSDRHRAGSYGAGPAYVHVALPTTDSVCVYTGAFDFWEAFDMANHEFGGNALEAVNDGFDELSKQLGVTCTSAQDVVNMCNTVTQRIKWDPANFEALPQEIRCMLTADGSNDLLAATNNMLDPSHMQVAKGGALNNVTEPSGGQEVALGGKIVYVAWHLFQDILDGRELY